MKAEILSSVFFFDTTLIYFLLALLLIADMPYDAVIL